MDPQGGEPPENNGHGRGKRNRRMEKKHARRKNGSQRSAEGAAPKQEPTAAAALDELAALWADFPPSGPGLCVYAEEFEHFLTDSNRNFDWLLRAAVTAEPGVGTPIGDDPDADTPADAALPSPPLDGADVAADSGDGAISGPAISPKPTANPAVAPAGGGGGGGMVALGSAPRGADSFLTGEEEFPKHKLAKLKVRSPSNKHGLPLMFFVFDPLGPRETAAVRGLERLRLAHGERLAVFPFAAIPTPAFEARALKIKAHGVREIKRRWMEPFAEFSQAHRPAFAVRFEHPTATVVARNAVTQLVHICPDSGDAFVFAIWSAKSGGEWAMPGGKVDLRDESLVDTASREFREECLGFTLEQARLDAPGKLTTEVLHERKDPRILPHGGVPAGVSWKYPCNTHLLLLADPAFHAATTLDLGPSAVGRFPGIDDLGPLAVDPIEGEAALLRYHRTPGAVVVEHEYYTWLWLPRDGRLTAQPHQVPPGHQGAAAIRREATGHFLTSSLHSFVARCSVGSSTAAAGSMVAPPAGGAAAPAVAGGGDG